jgi:hypothetical protein
MAAKLVTHQRGDFVSIEVICRKPPGSSLGDRQNFAGIVINE